MGLMGEKALHPEVGFRWSLYKNVYVFTKNVRQLKFETYG